MIQLPKHLIYPEDYDREQEKFSPNYEFIQSLQIDKMVILIKESHRGFNDLKLED